VINVFYLGGKKLKHCVEVLLICVFTVHSLITPHCQTLKYVHDHFFQRNQCIVQLWWKS